MADCDTSKIPTRRLRIWPRGDGWKAKVLTSEQPFLDEQQTESWLAAKADYKTLKAEGEV